MPDTHSPDNSSPVVSKLWVLTRVVKIAIRLCSRAAERKKVKTCEDLGRISCTFQSRRRNQWQEHFPSRNQGLHSDQGLLHFRMVLVTGTKFHKEKSLLMAFFGSKNKSEIFKLLFGSKNKSGCSFDYRKIMGLLPKKVILQTINIKY